VQKLGKTMCAKGEAVA